ncbi:DUF4998 domain-containing protein [Sphingobacterium sp. FBM7-1]|uniref:DUF4998 domain-containing protein n=1 Tax=Sphingobacterium sp. FBM7-1 TaxID=2886688 RepID=UPI001D0FFEB5|nr:DUF4998 domain-containing protein [Sphingobacterium sp. FBM7-1]MCC2599908.1 phosphodiester glycosidase family protein [Sphingobacterium sp. FBM7-1]
MRNCFQFLVIILITSLQIQGCGKGDSPKPDDVTPPSAAVKKLEIFSGNNRVKLAIALGNEGISHCEIYWEEKQKSRKINRSEAKNDTITTVIEELSEGEHQFEVVAYYGQHASKGVSTTAKARVYGNRYITSLKNRNATNFYFVKHEEPHITWFAPALEEVALEVFYTSESDERKMTKIFRNQLTTPLPGYKFGTPIEHRSLYLPSNTAIDTFYSAIQSIPPPFYYFSSAIQRIVDYSGLVASLTEQHAEKIHEDIEYSAMKFQSHEQKPLSVYILKADLGNGKLTLRTLMPNNQTNFALQPVKEMAEYRDGSGEKVFAAVNADFFQWTGIPWGLVYIDGVMVKNESLENNLSYFAIRKDGQPQIGIFSQLPATEHTNLRDAVGGGVHRLMVEGTRMVYGDVTPEPRTMVGYTSNNTIYLIVVDGRRATHSVGITIDGLSAIMNSLQVHGAINLDGGGSSTMVAKRNGVFEIMNRYSDANPRAVANSLAIVEK